MDIDVGEYRLNRFEESWCIRRKHVVQKGKMAGEVLWKDPQYFYKLELALKNLLNRMLREKVSEDEAENVETMIEVVEEAKEEILSAVRYLQEIKEGIFA